MSRVNNKWENEESWNYHIKNKDILKEIIESDNEEDLVKFNDMVWNESWLNNDGEGDPPNMDFVRNLWKDYWTYAEKKGIPIFEKVWLERGGKKIISLFRQDSAYSERIGGIIQWIIYHDKQWKKARNKGKRLEFLRDCMEWWNENDGRERTRGWIQKMWNRALKWYETKPFWEHSINFMIGWVIDHKEQWQPNQMYDPKIWFPKGRGAINTFVHGGVA